MTNEAIEKIVEKAQPKGSKVKIDFRKRATLVGIFVKATDYEDLKVKNMWRVVVEPNVSSWNSTNNSSFTRIFNGTEISKLSVVV